MKNLNRRQFISKSMAGAAAATIFPLIPGSLFASESSNIPFGFQAWTIREKLNEDFPGTLKMMADLGYTGIEMCSPLGYSMAGFAPLNKLKGSEMKKIIEDAGLTCVSSHYTMGEMRESLDNRIEWSLEMGITQIINSSFWLPDTATIDDYRKACDELNVMAEKIKKAGMATGFHNHHMELEKINGELIYDALLDQLDPDLVQMQFQVAVISIGYKAADFFRKHPGRFISAHLADWSVKEEKQVPVGQGVVDWKEFFEAAKVGGVKNFYVEMDPEAFKESAEFLQKL